ncbi:MAG: glycosyltransferase [Gorillibacterium sp.]|nr:glycosyltransferase [Gorillibacterium sp.]
MKTSTTSRTKNAVSILTCTKRSDCMDKLLDNYNRQRYKNKELIIILNHRSLKLNEYKTAAKPYKNVRIYRLPERMSLGSCLNYGIQLANHKYIAKFDDDDYYAPNYLIEGMQTMHTTNADIVGKRAHYMYLNGKKLLILRYANLENKTASVVAGATLLVKRHVFKQIAFPNRNQGECVKFCADCVANGFKIYSGSKYNFVAIRRRNSKNHTWIVSDKLLLARNVKVLKVKNIRSFVSYPPMKTATPSIHEITYEFD